MISATPITGERPNKIRFLLRESESGTVMRYDALLAEEKICSIANERVYETGVLFSLALVKVVAVLSVLGAKNNRQSPIDGLFVRSVVFGFFWCVFPANKSWRAVEKCQVHGVEENVMTKENVIKDADPHVMLDDVVAS
jgi:hypothetical protein